MQATGRTYGRARGAAMRTAAVLGAVGLSATGLAGAGLVTWAPQAVAAPVHGGSSTLGKAFNATLKKKTADMSVVLTEKLSGQTVKITATGALNFVTAEGNLTENIGGIAGAPAQTLQEVLAKGKAYIELPAAEQSLLGGKKWIAVSLGAAGSPSALGDSNPASALQLLQANATSIKKLGPAIIGGVSTTEYSAVVDPTKAAAKEPPAIRKQFKSAVSMFSGLHRVPLDVYIDGQDRVRRVLENVTLNPNAGSAASSVGKISVQTTIDLTNYGVPVSATPPPSSEVSHESLSQLEQGAASGGTGSATS